MPLALGSTDITKAYLGSTELSQLYLGTDPLLGSGGLTFQNSYTATDNNDSSGTWNFSIPGYVKPTGNNIGLVAVTHKQFSNTPTGTNSKLSVDGGKIFSTIMPDQGASGAGRFGWLSWHFLGDTYVPETGTLNLSLALDVSGVSGYNASIILFTVSNMGQRKNGLERVTYTHNQLNPFTAGVALSNSINTLNGRATVSAGVVQNTDSQFPTLTVPTQLNTSVEVVNAGDTATDWFRLAAGYDLASTQDPEVYEYYQVAATSNVKGNAATTIAKKEEGTYSISTYNHAVTTRNYSDKAVGYVGYDTVISDLAESSMTNRDNGQLEIRGYFYRDSGGTVTFVFRARYDQRGNTSLTQVYDRENSAWRSLAQVTPSYDDASNTTTWTWTVTTMPAYINTTWSDVQTKGYSI
jgi:hypothetical protein